MTFLDSVFTPHMAGSLALVIALAAMATGIVRVPYSRRGRGVTLHSYPVPIRYRLRRQRVPLLVLGLVIAGDLGLGLVPSWVLGTGLVVAIALVATPVRLVLSTAGVRMGWLPVRRWTEFGGLRVRRGTIRLQPIAGSSGFEIPLPGRFEDGDLVAEVRGMITRAYKGAATPEHLPTQEPRPGGDPGDETTSAPLAIAG